MSQGPQRSLHPSLQLSCGSSCILTLLTPSFRCHAGEESFWGNKCHKMLEAEALLKPPHCMVVKEEIPDGEGHWGLTHPSLFLGSVIKQHLCFCFMVY